MAQSSYEQGLELVEQQIIHCTNGHQKKDGHVSDSLVLLPVLGAFL